MFASNDGKELSLTFYTESGARTRRVTLPKPDFTPLSMAATARGHLFLGSPTEILCLDSDLSDLASLGEGEGEGRVDVRSRLEPRCLSGLGGMGAGVGDVLVANWASGNVEVRGVGVGVGLGGWGWVEGWMGGGREGGDR